ncbi:tetratricopeptide repeat protein [Bernardetia sp. ABR2-2B]|uniref:tetratricopeptide repeat protein n=1 Tax=Bernardetia sp. ABR2-2B TaxID=3127472 RepID=UPI0030D1F8FD
MKLFVLTLIFCLSSLTILKAQGTSNLDSLETTIENLSWKELNSMGKDLRSKANYPESEIYFKKALQVAKKQNGKDSLYAVSCRELGIVYYYQGNYDETELLWLEAKNIREKILGKEHPDYTESCSNIMSLYYQQGLYQKAEPLCIEAKNIREQILGKESIEYASSCNNLAALYYKQGLYQKAEPLYIEAKKITEKILGKEHPDYATYCSNLAVLYSNQDLYQKAELLYIEAKNIREKMLGKEHPDYATSCDNLAFLYQEQGLYQKAEPLCIKAKNIREKVLGKEHPNYAQSCDNVARLYHRQGLYQKAESLYIEAKNIREKILGKEHPDYAISCNNLAKVYKSQELYQKAEPLYIETIENKKKQIAITFPTLSESEKQEYFSSINVLFTNYIKLSTEYYSTNKAISKNIFNQQLFTKGIIFSSTQKMKQQILSSGDSTLINQYEDWKTQKEDYISLLQTPISERDSSINLKEIAFQINELERKISKKSVTFKENTQVKEYLWLDVQKKLEKDEATIELIRLVREDKQGNPKDTVYVALILTDQTKESPELLVLENGNELENGALSFYQNNIDFQLEDTESYNQYWKPIQDKLDSLASITNTEEYSKVYFSADGIYHKLNLNTLLNPKTNKFLIEEQNIQLITSSRDLIEQKSNLKKNFKEYNAYLLGYPSYNLNGEDTLKINGEDRSLNGLQRVIGQQTVVPVLEGTKVETNKITSLLNKKSVSTTLFQNEEATEENIKALQNPTVLHFATHGFFINKITKGEPKTLQEAEDRNLLKNPFLRSGLLLAGCQNPQTGEDDGILSAEEAMNLNLDSTELVVLSACETGLGDIENGEGVYGLQRAFRQAGAKTLLMSLWKVSDEATQLLMVTFYENLLNGKSKREAFKAAQLKLKEKYNEPYYWGAFVMVGE